MIPIVKGWSTEVAQHVAYLGVQVHGGMGFIEETGAAQFARDARITTIYEGTTGIQANDFVGRKIARDGGETLAAAIAEMRQTERALVNAGDPTLAAIGTRINGVNYIRNAIKVTIDAYHGRTTYHVVDPSDPIAQTVARIFPDLLKPLDAMPESLRTRLRYPQQIFVMQASMFATFHMTNPAVFYNREDQWEIPTLEAGPKATPMHPYYTIMKLPGEGGPEYIQMLPFTPRGKDNLASWMVARSDGANYGKLAVFQFPKQTVIFGPRQVAARINQDQAISPQITLWNQQGSEVIQGTLLVIPIEESLIYIRPLDLKAVGGQFPS